MWQSDEQACKTIRAMLKSARLDRMWTDEGPTEEAVDLLEARGGPLSHGEAVMLRAAFALWNGKGDLTLDELLTTLDPENMRAVLRAVLVLRHDVGKVG